jgi:hypothetical protein
VSARHSLYRRASNDFPSGSEQVAALLKEAEIAVNTIVEPGKRAQTMKLLRLDRPPSGALRCQGPKHDRIRGGQVEVRAVMIPSVEDFGFIKARLEEIRRPFCAEAIISAARVCRFCGRKLPADW